MNQDQTVSLVTKLLVSAATAVTIKWGLSASETQDIVTDASYSCSWHWHYNF
jgi:hypothetical protein